MRRVKREDTASSQNIQWKSNDKKKDIEYGSKRDSDSNNSSIHLSSTQATCKLLLGGDKLIDFVHIQMYFNSYVWKKNHISEINEDKQYELGFEKEMFKDFFFHREKLPLNFSIQVLPTLTS